MLSTHLTPVCPGLSIDRDAEILARLSETVSKSLSKVSQLEWVAKSPEVFSFLDRMPNSEQLVRIDERL